MLSNATGANWRQIRTTISPTFTSVKLRQLNQLIHERAEKFSDILSETHFKEIEVTKVTIKSTISKHAFCLRLGSYVANLQWIR